MTDSIVVLSSPIVILSSQIAVLNIRAGGKRREMSWISKQFNRMT